MCVTIPIICGVADIIYPPSHRVRIRLKQSGSVDTYATFFRALDFLYIDYNAPPCVGVLINPDVLSKYKRVFTFLLRLLRGWSSQIS